MTEIKTNRLKIVPMTESELSALINQYRDAAPALAAAYREMLDGCTAHPEQALWYTAWNISLADGGETVGSAGFKGFCGGRPELGYGIDDAYAGCGYATEAVGGLCRWALRQPGVAAIEAEAEADNAASRRVLEKNGFSPTGETGAEGPRYLLRSWFTVETIDADTFILSEYRHWEETHCYLLTGRDRALLIDTGLGVCDISAEVRTLTQKPVTAAATHIHWDHIGGHRYYPDFYAHEAELDWLTGGFPLDMETIRGMVLDRCDPPAGYDVNTYEFFQGTPTRLLRDGDAIDLGGRVVTALHTPGHSPGHLCFWEAARGYLFTGDLIYKDTLFAYYPSTDPQAYLASLEKVAALPAKRVFPAHHSLDIRPALVTRMRDAFRKLNKEGKLCHGSGTFDYGDWAVWL